MGALTNRTTATAALLLATLAFSGVFAHGHAHDSLDLPTAHGDLPIFSAGHEQPDHAAHVEGATHLEPDSCVGCLRRQRERADSLLAPALGSLEPSFLALAGESAQRVETDASRLPASRAPPRA